jgi:hypothetical protein
MNSQYVDYFECDFSEKQMHCKDPKDFIGKEGSGRVAIGRMTNLIHCYTFEMFYHCPKKLHNVSHLVQSDSGRKCPEFFT